MGLDEAVTAVRDGRPVLVHDGDDREDETDMVFPAAAVQWQDVRRLRNDAGGLICVAVDHETGQRFDLPLLDSVFTDIGGAPPYDDRSSFSISVNHVSTRTGVTDRDRATTIQELARAVDTEGFGFREAFRAPGHVPVLIAAPDGLDRRQGHTELSIALMERAGVTPAAVVCEMLDDATGRALPRDDAQAYAAENDLVFLDATELLP
ncbi:MAG: 3,4-dihydroxy-2-butanone-4-phosphate synthase [Candidatus Nanohaloarchaea archaeon]|nr:3,4-dihydroxy-2-butanone-4-phosphate synthase [Candidatus Nanohaloarchaea archaeon]